MTSAPHIPTPTRQIVIESKDRRRMWTVTPTAAGFDVNGIRNDNDLGWMVAGHHHFDLQADAVGFARSICGLAPLEKEIS